MSRTAVASLDLTDSRTFMEHDPFQFFAEVRASKPVYWHAASGGRPGFWVVAGYADVVSCYGASGALASGRGTVLDVLLRGDDSAGGRMLAVTDRPRHRELRALMWRALSPKVLEAVARKVEQRTAALIERAVGLKTFDFATEVAEHVPMNTICDLLSIPEADRPQLLRWSKGALTGADELDSLESRNELVLYFMDLAERRRVDPGDDVISTIATGQIQGEPLSLEEVALNCYSLIIGGDESSRVSAVSTVKALAEHPAQWRDLRAGRVDLDAAVEEALLGDSLVPLRPYRHSRPRHRGSAGAGGRHRVAVEHLSQQRRAGVLESAHLRPVPVPEQARRPWPRTPLLPGGLSRPGRTACAAERARRDGPRSGGHWAAHPDSIQLSQRLQLAAGAFSPEVTARRQRQGDRMRTEKRNDMRVTVDQQRCIGSGMCVLAVGEVFDQREEDGAVHLLREDVPSELQDRVRHAARVCPSRAITVPQETDA